MARTFVLLAALVALSATATATNPPGLRVAITDPGLTELKNVALPIINAALQDVTLPNMNLQEHVPVLGHISLDLSNMKVTGFRLPNAVLAVSSPPQFTMDMSGLTLQVSLNYAWRKVHWPHISDHGSVTATPQGGSVDLTMSIGSSGGHVVLDTTNAAVSFSSFKIHFSGKVSWLYNLLVGLFKGSIKKAVQSAVQKQLQNAVDTSLNKALARIKLTDTLGGGKSRVNVNVGVVDITAGSDYLSLGDMLAISNNMTGAACPIVPHTLPSLAPGAAGSMLQLLLDDSFLNCVSWSATSNGALTTTLTDASLPKAFPLRLNTSDWGKLIPELQAKYPDRPMQLLLSPQAAPSITSSASGVTGEMAFALNFSVVTTAGTPTPVFAFASSLALGLNVQVKPAATNPVLVLNITELELDLTLTGSQVGTINLAPIQSLFHTFLPLLKDILNGFLSKGFPLPSTDGLQLVGPSVEFDAGFLAIATNFTFATAEAADAATPAFVKPTPMVDPMAAQLDALRLGELVQHLRGSKQM